MSDTKKAVKVSAFEAINEERDDIAIQVASGLAHLCSQGNQINYKKVAESAYGIADALIAHRGK
jgi:hypothetical protein